jgi:hypothetical protein
MAQQAPTQDAEMAASVTQSSLEKSSARTSPKPLAPCAFDGSGTANFIPLWTGPCSQINSSLFQTTTGNVGLGTNVPGAMFDVQAPSTINSPVARFGSSVVGSSNSIAAYTGFCLNNKPSCKLAINASSELFISGAPNTYVPGTAAGDGGLRVAPGMNIFFGDSEHSRLLVAGNGRIGIGQFSSTFPLQAALDVISYNTNPVVRFSAGGNQDIILGLEQFEGDLIPVFRVDSSGKVFANGFQTGGADFAESVAVQGARERYEPGDLLVVDRIAGRRLVLASEAYATSVAGIYSTKPGLLGTMRHITDPGISDEVPLAVVGIVPCKVSAENGGIRPGDLLVSSGTPGYAMKGTNRKRMLGAVLGKALEPLPSGKGKILVLVTLQ